MWVNERKYLKLEVVRNDEGRVVGELSGNCEVDVGEIIRSLGI